MKRYLIIILLATLGVIMSYSCKCSSESRVPEGTIEQELEEDVQLSLDSNIIGLWVTKIARDDSFQTLSYTKGEKQFYIHDELKNEKGTYYDKVSPVAVTLQADGRYYITYQNGMKDCYYINPDTGLMDWRCEGYNPETVKPKSFNAKLFKLAIEDKQ